jgi:hypothetical protein
VFVGVGVGNSPSHFHQNLTPASPACS